MAQASRDERRRLRRAGRRRRRGGDNRAPVAIQRAAEQVEEAVATTRDQVEQLRRAVTGGDRPLILAVLAVVLLAVVTISGPLQNYLDARGRVGTLRAQAQALEQANGDLRRQVEDLRDPRHLELLVREEYGWVRPGQVAYTIVPPETDRPRITEPVGADQPAAPWYRRLWERVGELVS